MRDIRIQNVDHLGMNVYLPCHNVIIFSNFSLLVLGRYSSRTLLRKCIQGRGRQVFFRTFDRFYVFDLAVQ